MTLRDKDLHLKMILRLFFYVDVIIMQKLFIRVILYKYTTYYVTLHKQELTRDKLNNYGHKVDCKSKLHRVKQ